MRILRSISAGPARSPFSEVIVALVIAAAGLAGAIVWIAAGGTLPGGRWTAVHLFTLGVLTPLVLGFSRHFAVTLTRAPDDLSAWPVLIAGAGAVVTLVGVAGGIPALTALGGTAATVAVLAGYRTLRRLRRSSLGARFAWIVRLYERAHGAFVHGAILGILMGTGLVAGRWYGGVRLAHLHVNVLGWGALTLLATLVFFGPTIVRQRIEPGADDRAARALRRGATGVTIASLALIATGFGGSWGTAARLVAAAGLSTLAVAATGTCRSVLRAGRASTASPRWRVIALCGWLPVALWGDVVIVATGWWRALDAVGVAIIMGVLLQAILATVTHVVPTYVSRDTRERIRSALDRAALAQTVVFNLGVAALVVCAWLGRDLGAAGAVLARAGVAAVVAATISPLVRMAAVMARRRVGASSP